MCLGHGTCCCFLWRQTSCHGQTFDTCWCRLLEHRRAAWWEKTLLLAASLAWIWSHCAREFSEMMWKATDVVFHRYFLRLCMLFKTEIIKVLYSVTILQLKIFLELNSLLTGRILALEHICLIWQIRLLILSRSSDTQGMLGRNLLQPIWRGIITATNTSWTNHLKYNIDQEWRKNATVLFEEFKKIITRVSNRVKS